MKRIPIFVLFAVLPLMAFAKNDCRVSAKELNSNTKEQFIDGLMSRMTVEEKIGQLNLPGLGHIDGDIKKCDIANRIRNSEVGGFFNYFDFANVRKLQEVAVRESRLGIPLIIGADVCEGYKTTFPVPLGMSSSFKPENIERAARISAEEASTIGVCWTYSPNVDICRDARWGRCRETAGEDAFLGSAIARAWVKGYQGNDLSAANTIMSCVKHFALYGAAEAGRDYNPVDMSRATAMNYFMPPYKAAVDAGVGSVMSSFNEFEGVPATGNSWLLKDVLRDDWGFKGFVVSDYTAIKEMEAHGVGGTTQVTQQALKCGIDMDMIADYYHENLMVLLKDGTISMADIDCACRRMLEAKYDLGLFHDPFKYMDEQRREREFYKPDYLLDARRIAAESYVLLKNEGNVLPLRDCGKIAIVGALADAEANMTGTWRDVVADRTRGLDECLRAVMGDGVEIAYSRGCNLDDDATVEYNFSNREKNLRRDGDKMLIDALAVAANADVVIVAVGESITMSSEGASKAVLELPDTQRDLLRAMKATGKPIVMLVFAGRPLAIEKEAELADAILYVWEGGCEAGPAMAEILSGKVSPTAKLPMSMPRVTGQCPIYYNHKNTGRPMVGEKWYRYVSNYIDVPNSPLYPFGYGLSYTTFKYGDVVLDATEMSSTGKISASVEVANTGDMDGEEIVQLYIHDMIRSTTPPVRELKGFCRVSLRKGEKTTVSFSIDVDLLKFYNADLQLVAEPGEFEVMIGGNSRDVKTAKFILR